MAQQKKRVFYGWVIVLAGTLITGAGVGIYNNMVSVFVKPVCEALGFACGQFTLYTTVSTLTSTLAMPYYGELFRKHGVKRFLLTGTLVCGLVPMGYSLSSQLWHFYLLAFINGLMVNGVGMLIVGTLVSGWFRDKLGLATGLAYAGSGFVAAVMLPVVGQVIELAGWRWAYRVVGIAGMAVLLPTVLLLVRERPADMGLLPYTDSTRQNSDTDDVYQPVGLTRAQALRTPTFWLLTVAVAALGTCGAGAQNHTVPFISDIGYSPAYASAVASAQMLVLTAGKILLGAIFDRFGARAGSIFVGVCTLSFPLLALAARLPGLPWLYALTLGFACSGGTVPIAALTRRYFGDKDFASIFSLCTMACALGVSVSTPIMGTIYDLTGSYKMAWFLCLGLACIVTLGFGGASYTARSLEDKLI